MRKLHIILFASLVFISLTSKAQALSVTAASGSAADIQAAVDQVAAAGGGTVYLPEGDFACDIDTSLGPNPPPFSRPYAVLIPGGVSIIGQGIGKTILRQTEEPVNLGNMFIIDGRNGLRTRISGITFIGAPFSVEGEPAYTNGIYMHGATDFRIDHCYFENWNSKAISCSNTYEGAWGDNRGVIDHCTFDNPYKDDPNIEGAGTNGRKTWGYGIIPGGKGIDQPTDYYLGKYDGLEDIVYIEDCNFYRTRHAIASNSYGWYVVRNSKFYEPRPEHYAIIDVHGFNFGRGLEAYNNEIYGCEYRWNGTDEVSTGRWLAIAFGIRGGGGVIFNNSLIDINKGVQLSDESPESGEGRIDDLWIWNNAMITQDAPPGYTGDDGTYILPGEFVEGVEYHLTERPGYVPYPYPHPLTIDSSSKHRLWGRLLDADSNIIQSEISALIEGTDTVITSNQTDDNGDYGLEIQPGTYDIQYQILKTGFYVPDFLLRFYSINVSNSIKNLIKTITEYPTEKKIAFTVNATTEQRIQTHSHIKPKRVVVNGTPLTEVSSILGLTDNTWYYEESSKALNIIVNPGSLPNTSRLHVEGRHLKDDYGRTVILRGFQRHGFEDDPEGRWKDLDGTYFNQFHEDVVRENLRELKKWGANEIRIIERAQYWIDNPVGGTGKPHRDCIKRLVEIANEEGLYVVFVMFSMDGAGGYHNIPWGNSLIPTRQDFAGLWLDVASEIGGYPNVIFELWNEVAYGDMEEWFTGCNETIRALRDVGYDNIVIVQWSWDVWHREGEFPNTFTLDWVNDPNLQSFSNLLYSTHIYRDARGFYRYENDTEMDYNNWENITRAFEAEKIYACVDDWNKPLYIGEYGPNHNLVDSDNPDYPDEAMIGANNGLVLLDEHDISINIMWWFPGIDFGLYEDKGGEGCDWTQRTPWGDIVYDFLQGQAQKQPLP